MPYGAEARLSLAAETLQGSRAAPILRLACLTRPCLPPPAFAMSVGCCHDVQGHRRASALLPVSAGKCGYLALRCLQSTWCLATTGLGACNVPRLCGASYYRPTWLVSLAAASK